MIYHDGKKIISRRYNSKRIIATYRGRRLVWQEARGCFSAGYWNGAKPWVGEEAWKG